MPVEPLSIVVACTSLISNVGKTSLDIYSFVSKVRDAHRDLDAVLKELSSLGLCLETLRNDAMVTSKGVPQPLEHRVLLILVHTAEVVKEIQEMLGKLSSDRFGNHMKWAMYGQNDINKLRNRLESHKASLEIALALLTLSLTTAIKDDTSSIRRNVKETAFGLDQIAQVLVALPERVAAQLQGSALNEATIVDTIRPALQPAAPPEAPVANSTRKLEGLFPPMNSNDQTLSNCDAAAIQPSREVAVTTAESTLDQLTSTTQDQASRSRRWKGPQIKTQLHKATKVADDKKGAIPIITREYLPERWNRAAAELGRQRPDRALEDARRRILRRLKETEDQKKARGEPEYKFKPQFESLGPNESLEWDGLRRREIIIHAPSVPAPQTIHPPLGMSHFPDADNDDGWQAYYTPGIFESIRRKVESGPSQGERHEEERSRLWDEENKHRRPFSFSNFFKPKEEARQVDEEERGRLEEARGKESQGELSLKALTMLLRYRAIWTPLHGHWMLTSME
ncbi:uncharacterized protein Z519_07102 [Cladophialophora bantiana CBS 173.52]|uniref:Azaphilone pigments biosynthesis cluster protein L N-terminal domain-containing protein n=1 Tax=Cladophialophora bantiana (strain ATCC 10958 / CBS 173.52 / CDC B-1940 / NIH 8579) TaxID=1442370 RepID=A0A0D2HFT0_CLAB1|nr:uncharacterized protein Z519_07102 [Cladophialophora bantiana CBS 173.52]KIW92118.1 hypothetical protein Z519_07102 [Cladophialophora bantiana CBS 173.52]